MTYIVLLEQSLFDKSTKSCTAIVRDMSALSIYLNSNWKIMATESGCTLFIVSTVQGCVQKQSWTEANVMPLLWECRAVSIIWLESSEWMKFGGKALRCFRTIGWLKQHEALLYQNNRSNLSLTLHKVAVITKPSNNLPVWLIQRWIFAVGLHNRKT